MVISVLIIACDWSVVTSDMLSMNDLLTYSHLLQKAIGKFPAICGYQKSETRSERSKIVRFQACDWSVVAPISLVDT